MHSAESLLLDPSQQSVVAHDGGPMLVLGGPGTGKTTVLVERWVRLGREVTQPHRVLMLVPVRERALALRDELPWRLDARAVIEVPVHTWHALAYHLVTRYYRRLGYVQPPVRLTAPEQWTVVRDLLATEDPKAWGPYAQELGSHAVASEVADFCIRAGHRAMSDDDLRELAERRPDYSAAALFAIRYRAYLESTSALDYAGLILAATRLLDDAPDVRDAVHHRFPHVLVDDAQELAPAQIALLQRVCTSNLVCSADPDSAVETFRGADASWLERFGDVAGPHDQVSLSTCHRLGKEVGEVAMRLIGHAPAEAGHRPEVFTGPDSARAELRIHTTMAGEIETAARDVRAAHLTHGVPYERMAILCAQMGSYVNPLVRACESLDVPYKIDTADRPLLAEPVAAAVLDMCRMALTSTAASAPDDLLPGLLSCPLVGLHPHRVRELRREAYRSGRPFSEVIAEAPDDEAAEYRRLIEAASSNPDEPADATFTRIFETSAWCRDAAKRRSRDMEAARAMEVLSALGRALGHFVERRPGATMRDYLAGHSDFAAETWSRTISDEGVFIGSLHSAKGRQWDLVWVLGVAEGHIPKAHRAQGLFDPWALEAGPAVERELARLAEERRTLYVALTRGRESVTVSASPGTRRDSPSRFLEEAFGALPEAVSIPDGPPLTLAEAAARFRRTLADTDATEPERAAAAAALARIPGVDTSGWWWRRAPTPGAELTPGGNLTTSYSRIGRYDECPLRYVLESVLGLDPESTYQMKFGSLVHKVIEESDPAHGTIKDPAEAMELYRKEFTERHQYDYPNAWFARTYYRFGVRALERWWKTERENGETVAVEFAFDDLDVEGHTIRGRIDRVAKVPDGLVLCDYKTSARAASWDDAKKSLQLAIYYLAARTYPDLVQHGSPVRMELVYPGVEQLDKHTQQPVCAKRIQYPKEAEDALARLKDLLDGAVNERFDPAPEADCQWCRMRPLCPRWPEGREIPL